ncbi:hypothetical protein SKAU_G00390820 [Synaphobranchus kaupii]|uniref:Uncharacterized protein n=1 Tax=Synaphobranchus kaupii TaxID=118154 RepID=A0A9Q1EBF3_SYNKA|nr:hypothetical protein SKAU_G00390820 [Synaphobranchus kaupii]
MYSKHRQKKVQFTLTECGHSLIFLFLLLLNNVLETESGDSTEQAGKSHGQTVVPHWLSQSRTRREAGIPQQVRYQRSPYFSHSYKLFIIVS